MFKIIGAADATANLLCEFKIAEKNEAKLIKKIKGNVIFVSWIASKNFAGSDLNPGAISETKRGMNNSTIITNTKSEIVKRLKILFANSSDFFFTFS